MELYFEGLAIGAFTFFIIGVSHPIVIKTEYYFFKDLEHIVFIAFSVVKTMCFLVTISNSYSECG